MSIGLGEEKCNRDDFSFVLSQSLTIARPSPLRPCLVLSYRGACRAHPCPSLCVLMGLKLFSKIMQISVAIPKTSYKVKPIESHCAFREPCRVPLFEIVKPDRA
jgi:hypothetical protein